MNSSYVIMYVETTGLEFDSEIIDMAVMDIEGKVLLDTLIKPQQPIPADATSIHGITNLQVADAPYFADIVPQLLPLLMDKTVVSHNAVYLYNKLDYEFQKINMSNPLSQQAFLCTMFQTTPMRMEWIGLKQAVERYHIALPEYQPYRALFGAECCRRLLNQVILRNGI